MKRIYTRRLPSFRDPAGRLVDAEGRILRWISPAHRDEFETVAASSVVLKAIENGQIVPYCVLHPSEARQLAEHYELTESEVTDRGELVLEHERVPFPSFPYEWPPEMLEAAGRLTLDLAESLLDDGLGIKDATPYNVLFRGAEPVFIDVLSIERRDPRDPLWLPYAQFVRTFLLPLVLHKRFGLPLESLLLGRRDGIEPEEAYRICGPLARMRSPMLTLVTLPTWLGSRREDSKIYRKRQARSAEQAQFILRGILRGLRRQLVRLKRTGKEWSRWSNYVEACESYTTQQLEQKRKFIDEVLSKYRPRRVFDAGCNTGQFSLQAARAGASVVAIDSDPVVVGRLWRQAHAERLDILPLVINLARPSPAVGWQNAECASLLDRVKGEFDTVWFLALLHHLLVSERIPLVEVINLVAEITTDLAVIEYVGTDDPMFQHLLRGREALYQQLTTDVFETAVREKFKILQSERLTGSSRHLYLLKKLPNAGAEQMGYPSEKGSTR
jgi:SAM-dependent methyltransferase